MATLVHDSRDSSEQTAQAELVLGEIRTGLLRNSGPIRSEVALRLLALMPQQLVRRWERPVRHAASPEVLTGVDCQMPSASGRGLRGVGTMATDVRITGGQIVQASTRVQVVQAQENRRLSWSRYLTRPATVETWGPVRAADLVAGFLSGENRPEVMDLASPSAHRMNTMQASTLLDGAHTYRPERARLRWTATASDGPPAVTFSLESPQLHTLRLEVPAELLAEVANLCQDVALHDWLLSSLIELIDRAQIGGPDRSAVVKTLAPAIDHLMHAWLPGARIGDQLMTYWAQIERRSGLTRQWENAVARIRDQVALATVELAVAASQSTGQVAGKGNKSVGLPVGEGADRVISVGR